MAFSNDKFDKILWKTTSINSCFFGAEINLIKLFISYDKHSCITKYCWSHCFKGDVVLQRWQIRDKQTTVCQAGSLSEHNHRILPFVIKTHQNIITNLLEAKVRPTALTSPWKLHSSEHILVSHPVSAAWRVVCSSQCVWLRRIRCMAVCTMGIQPCVAGGFAGWRQYSSQMQTHRIRRSSFFFSAGEN